MSKSISSIKGCLLLLFVVATTSGIGKVWEIVTNFFRNIQPSLLLILQSIKSVFALMDVTDILPIVIYSGTIMIASYLGVFLTRKCKNRLWNRINMAVSVVSTLTTIFSVIIMYAK